MSHRPESAAPDLDLFVERFQASLADGSFVRLVLSSPSASAGATERVLARLIDLRGLPALSITGRESRRDRTHNLPLAEAPAWLRLQLAGPFRAALLGTRARDWQLSLPEGRPPRLRSHPPAERTPPPRTHDRTKQHALDRASSHDWLQALGLEDAQGRIPPSRADKHRQVLRYAEILGHLVDEVAWDPEAVIHAADMGCGRGYLTFAAWQILRRDRGRRAEVRGIEARPELAAAAEATARTLGLEGLSFAAGTIAGAAFERLDLLVALHACNTATDDALRRGIELGCRLIVVAPCCHQEVRPQLGRPDPLGPVLRHGIMAERLAEWVTDGLRALFLEWAGYRVKLVEFVASEHTPKNLLLAAVRIAEPFRDPAARDRITDLMKFCGIRRHALDPLLLVPDPPAVPSPG